MTNGITVIIPSELESYEETIKTFGLATSDFKLTQYPPPIHQVRPFISGIVKIKYKPTGIERTYDICMGYSWPVGFQVDLNQGNFGRIGFNKPSTKELSSKLATAHNVP